MARPTIYTGKTERLNAFVSPAAIRRIEQARLELANISGWDVEDVSITNALEYLLTGAKPKRRT